MVDILHLLRRLSPRTSRLDFFIGAVWAHVLKGDEAAGLAAFIAGVESDQRTEMIASLHRLSDELQSQASMISEGPTDLRARRAMIARVDGLASRISAGKWGRLEIAAVTREIRSSAPEYLKAYTRADASIFFERYPDLRLLAQDSGWEPVLTRRSQ